MVVAIAILGVLSGLAASVMAVLSGVSILGVIMAYVLTGALASVLLVVALALRPTERMATSEGQHDPQTA